LYSLLQDVMRKPVKFYKMIDEERKYLEIKLADNEIKDIMKSQIQHLGQIKVLVYYGVRKNVGEQYSYESTGYTKEQYKMSRPNVQKILYKNVQLVCLS